VGAPRKLRGHLHPVTFHNPKLQCNQLVPRAYRTLPPDK
jgi:hypothetical protein